MSSLPERKIVFLDTNIFESQNFLKGRNLNTLCRYAVNSSIELKITDIIYKELIQRISVNVNRAKKIHKDYQKQLNGDGRILRNSNDFESLYNFPKFNSVEIKKEIGKKLDVFITKNNIEIINSDIANIEDVFTKYFNTEAPFKDGNKKHEFPDAFIFSTIENWAIANERDVFLISSDNDINNIEFESGKVDTSFDLTQILEKFSKEINKEHSDYIESKIENFIEDIKNKLSEDYKIDIEDSVNQNLYKLYEYESASIVSEVIVKNIIVNSTTLNSLELNESFSYEIDFEIDFEIEINYIDLSCASYDKEDDKWFGYEEINKTLDYKADCIANAIFWYEFDEASDNISFKEIEDFGISNLELNE